MSIRSVSRTGVLEALRDRSLRTVNRVLWLSVVAFASVVALRQLREPFAAASDVGDVIFDLSIAYVAGWIFFYLTSWRPIARQKALVLPNVARSAVQLAGVSRWYLSHISDASSGALPKGAIDRKTIAEVVANLPAVTPMQMFAYEGAQFDLVAGVEHAVRRVDERVLEIERWGTFVEPEFLRLVYSVTDAAFLRHSRDGLLNALRPNSLFGAGGAEALIKWCEASDRLRLWVCDRMASELTDAGYDVKSVRETATLAEVALDSRFSKRE